MSILYICKQVHVDKANMEYATREEVDSRSPLNQKLVAAIAKHMKRAYARSLHLRAYQRTRLLATTLLRSPQTGENPGSLLLKPPYIRWLIGTAGCWFPLDIAYYGTTISSPLVLKALNSHALLTTNTLYTLLIFVVAALPGYILAIFTIDPLGRKLIQCLGFVLMTLAYGLIAFAPHSRR
jgi:hypothetical protein